MLLRQIREFKVKHFIEQLRGKLDSSVLLLLKSHIESPGLIIESFFDYLSRSCMQCYDYLCQKDVNSMVKSKKDLIESYPSSCCSACRCLIKNSLYELYTPWETYFSNRRTS